MNRRVMILAGLLMVMRTHIWAQNSDFDGSGKVDFSDFFLFADVFGQRVNDANRRFDLNGDLVIDFDDFFSFADNFGKLVETKPPEELRREKELEARRQLGALSVQYDRQSFIKAVENEDLLVIGLFVDAGMDPNTKNDAGKPLLVWATENNKLEVINLLLDKTADINAKDGKGQTALIVATSKGFLEVVKVLLKRAADINAQDTSGQTALLYAVRREYAEIINALLDAKANVNLTDEGSYTPLWYAIAQGDTTLMAKLFDNGANINASERTGQAFLEFGVEKGDAGLVRKALGAGVKPYTGLPVAVQNGNVEMVHLLLEAAGQADSVISSSAELLRLYIKENDTEVIKALLEGGVRPDSDALKYWVRAQTEVVQLLLAAGAIPDRSIVLDAIEGGNAETVKILVEIFIEHGGDINTVVTSGNESALVTPAKSGNVEMVRALLEAGMNPNAGNDNGGGRPLNWAAYNGYTEVMRLLLEAGVDLTSISRDLWDLARAGKTEIIRLLLDKGVDASPALGEAISSCITDTSYIPGLQNLLGAGVDVNLQTPLLSVAAYFEEKINTGFYTIAQLDPSEHSGQIAVMRVLLEARADADVQDYKGWTALMYAVYQHDIELVRMLLKGGANVNIASWDGTVLIVAMDQIRGWVRGPDEPVMLQIVQTLSEAGADVNARDIDERTALIKAVLVSAEEVVRTLLEVGVDVNLDDSFGRTALMYARNRGNERIAQLLIDAGATE